MSKSAYLNVDLEEILKDIDLAAVTAAIETTPGFSTLEVADQDECRELVWLAAESWLARDLQEFESVEFEIPLAGGRSRLDMVAVMRGSMAPFDKYVGHKIIVDWKTTALAVDTDSWKQKCEDSWQWKIYGSLLPEAKLFNYRGLSRERGTWRGRTDEAVPARRVRDILLKLNDALPTEVALQKAGIIGAYNLWIENGLQVWPRNTGSCFAFNQRCPYKSDCDANTMPLGIAGIDKRDDMSYSRMNNVLLCPERARRNALLEAQDITEKDSDSTVIGTAFHEGVAKLWEEAFRCR
jgi:hypothetical protein